MKDDDSIDNLDGPSDDENGAEQSDSQDNSKTTLGKRKASAPTPKPSRKRPDKKPKSSYSSSYEISAC